MSLTREALVRATAIEVSEYIANRYGIEIDLYDLQDIININVGFVADAIEEQAIFYTNTSGE